MALLVVIPTDWGPPLQSTGLTLDSPCLPSSSEADNFASPHIQGKQGHGEPSITAFDEAPIPTHEVMPTYPDSIKLGYKDWFLVAVLVDTTGTVTRARIEESHPLLLEKLALDAARDWRFTPAKMKGKSVEVWYLMPIIFATQAE
jgi:TonB family protein